MKITGTDTTTIYYVEDGAPHYKVVRRVRTAPTVWGEPETWKVFSAQGIHAYQRECDPSKPTHKRIVAGVKALLNGDAP